MSKERELLIKAVEWMHELKYVWLEERDCGDRALLDLIADINKIEKLLYAAPPKREPLSEDEIAELWWPTYVVGTADSVRNFARVIEKAHGITGGGE
jgi:hypothetical protein